MDSLGTIDAQAFNQAVEQRDVTRAMELLGYERFEAEFMIALAHGDTEGCIPNPPDGLHWLGENRSVNSGR